MTHRTTRRFWAYYSQLPQETRELADRCYDLLKKDPHHPSLRLKKVGPYWSARVGLHYRAVAREADDGLIWIWIGTHSDYDTFIKT